MAKNDRKIGHDGVVRNVTGNAVDVVIESRSACSECHAKSVCGMGDTKQKSITAESPSFPVAPGDRVTVYANLEQAAYSVILAYAIPVFVILASVSLLLYSGAEEISAAFGALGGIAVYFILLYLNRKRIGGKIKFTIEKRD